MSILTKLTMTQIAVNDMPKAKDFYAEKLGFTITTDYRRDDDNWWVTLTLPEGADITLTTRHAHMQPGTQTLYFATTDIAAAHQAYSSKNIAVSKIKNNLHGPGSGTKWFNFTDPDGNLIHIEQV